MKRSVVGAILVFVALPLSAQIGRRSTFSPDPPYWVGLSYGYVDGVGLTDRDTQGSWQFSYASQIRATIEKTLQRGVTLGAAAGFTTANLAYRSAGLTTPDCTVSCQASADVTQYVAFIRRSGGPGFYSLFDLEAGVTRFSNFHDRASGNALPPTHASNDFTFGFGGGLGYGFSPTTSVYVSQQFDLVLHPQEEDATPFSAPRMLTLRAGFRVGF